MPIKDPEAKRRWNATAKANSQARQEAFRAELAEKMADYQPADVRTYGTSRTGFDYDAAIQAAAYYSVPPSGLPRNGGDAR